jgi:hypothetical protein
MRMYHDHAGRARGGLDVEVDPLSDMRRCGDAMLMQCQPACKPSAGRAEMMRIAKGSRAAVRDNVQ